MPTRNLDKLFYPRSVAVIGATNREGLPGQRVMRNLLRGGFDGPILPVTAGESAVGGVFAYPSIAALPTTPDLAIVCRATRAMPAVVRELGERGTRAAILVDNDEALPAPGEEPAIEAEILAAAKPFGLRILGPRSLGVIVPGIGLNASLAHTGAQPGSLAFVSQSSTVCGAVLEWGRTHDIGFSYFLSLGQTPDIDLGDVLDFLSTDAMTRGILLYIEQIGSGRAFLSAGRGASRNKPVIVIKAGRTAEGRRTVFGDVDPPGSDDVYDAAIRRAGMLRVFSFGELFAAVETLARMRPQKARRLAIICNGRGVAGIAVDALISKGGALARCAPATEAALAGVVARHQPARNPLILDSDAPASQYAEAARALLADADVDTLLVLHAPAGDDDSTAAAAAVIKVAAETRGQILTCWFGGEETPKVRRAFADAGIPTYDTPTQAIDAFLHMMHYRHNQELLMETPPSIAADFVPAVEAARALIGERLARGERRLSGGEAAALLAAYGIPTRDRNAAFPPRPAAHELMIAVEPDPVFGPVIVFGHGGSAAAVIDDSAVALPPLNVTLARELIGRTRVSRLLAGYDTFPAADLTALCRTLVAISQMIIDLPEIVRLEINPLFADHRGVLAGEARVAIAPAVPGEAERRLAIRPYPKDLEETFTLKDGRTVLLRPIRPEDEPAHYEFLAQVTPEDIRLRFFHLVRQLPHAEMARLTQIDYDREMAIIATAPKADGSGEETLGVVRIATDVNNERAEYAILVRSDQKGQGLGRKLMEKIIAYCRSRGTREIVGLVLRDNRRMLDLVHALGFTSRLVPDEDVISVRLVLNPPVDGREAWRDRDAQRPAA